MFRRTIQTRGRSRCVRQPMRCPILKAVMLGLESHDGWISLDVLGEKLARESNEFDVRTYGYRKLKDLLSELPGFVVDHPPLGLARVKLRDNR